MNTVTVTPAAIAKACEYLSREDRDDLRLRIAVKAGGCSGLIYELYFDPTVRPDDTIEEHDDLEVILDPMSIPYLDGATIDYQDTIQKTGFTINNPNAAGSCACGDSFH